MISKERLLTASIGAVLLFSGLAGVVSANSVSPITGIQMGASLDELQSFAEKHCSETTLIESETIHYPLAKDSEASLLCKRYTGTPIGFETAAFVIADGVFVQMEAHGVDTDSAHSALGEADGTYLGMENYREGTIWLDSATARLLWLTEDARHPNLFAWNNPVLGNGTSTQNETTEIPALLDFSASLEALLPEFEQQCPQMVVNENERIWLPNKPDQQVQIDCFGYSFAGFERKFEAVFGDGKLQVIWVLTGKPEESRLSARLKHDWGQPTMVNDSWEVYGDGRISLYKDKPEFLILSDEMIPLYQEMLNGD
ncbi:MAG TPA: hypothetical protein VJ984_04820 [Xanthomonadales bacterium]|nr:hypothetical protein [Xanthomonadales bacterium]